MERVYAVLTAVGSDRVGIADDIAKIVAGQGINIEESKMAVLGGEFAVIMLISGEKAPVEDLASELDGHGKKLALAFSFRRTRGPDTASTGIPYLLETVSQDTPGIVHSVTAVLHKHGVNIEDLETETTPAPWTGAPLFHMRARIILPPTVHASKLRREFAELEEKQDLHIEIKPLYPVMPE
jgi:glycine cleavage system transcriptional repressor